MIPKLVLLICALCLFSLSAHSHAQCPGQQIALEPFAKEKLTIGATASGLTPSLYQQSEGVAALAVIQVRDAPIAFSVVGTPTVDTDTIVTTWASFPVCGIASIRAFKALRYASTDASLIVVYYKSRQP